LCACIFGTIAATAQTAQIQALILVSGIQPLALDRLESGPSLADLIKQAFETASTGGHGSGIMRLTPAVVPESVEALDKEIELAKLRGAV